MYTLEQLQQKSLNELKEIGWQLNVVPAGDRRYRQSWIDALVGVNPPLLQLLEVSPAASIEQVQEVIVPVAKTSPVGSVEQVQESPIESKFGRIVYPRPAQEAIVQVAKTSPAASVVEQAQGAIALAAQNSPGVEVDQLPECVECFGDGYFEDEAGLIKSCQCSASEPTLSRQMTQRAIVPASKNLPGSCSKTTAHQLLELFKSSAHIIEDSPGVKTEATVSESAIAPAAKNRIKEGSDENPILTGIPLSDRFVTRYTPPQPEIIHFQSDADGQLSLLDFEVESVEEPPDPDDFESLDAFREAIALWDVQNPEPFAASIDSMCEWAPCPEEWYEPKAEILPLKASSMIKLPEQSEVLELLQVGESSDTLDFFIPTFGRLGDRSHRSDEPPDTGIFARLPKPKPPKFPPQAASWTEVGRKSAQVSPSQPKSARYPEAIPKLFHRVVACSTLPARSPPGGDA